MRIPFCEPFIEPDLPQVVAGQVASGWWGPGSTGKLLANRLTADLHARYGVLTVSGTVALSLAADALFALTVHVPAYGVVSVPNAFASVDCELIPVDIDRETGCMSTVDLERAEVNAPVCFVDFSGYRGPGLHAMRDYCHAENLLLIEDAACATPDAPFVGDITTYSFSMPKWVTAGQGGAVVTSEHEYYRVMAAYTDHGGGNWREANLNVHTGSNLRLTDIQASIALHQLAHLDERIARKQAAYNALKGKLGDNLFTIPNEPPLHNIVFAQRRDALIGKLNEQGIDARWQYRTISQHPCYKHLAGNYPNADWWTDHAVYLPFGMALTEEQADTIANAVLASGEELIENRSSTPA